MIKIINLIVFKKILEKNCKNIKIIGKIVIKSKKSKKIEN